MIRRELTASEKAFWQEYLESLPPHSRPKDPSVEVAYAGNQEITDGLLALYLKGKKTAGSSLVKDFESNGDPLPEVGNYWIVLDSNSNPGCIVKTVKVAIHRFSDIPEEIAKAEGEGDCSVAYWKKVHQDLYTPHLASWGIRDINDAEVITEFFDVVHVMREREDFFIGEIILESLIDSSVIESFGSFVVSSRTADVKNFDPSHWHIHRYRMPLIQVQALIPRLQNNIDKNQWYIHFYSENSNRMFVVLSGRTFELPKSRDGSWDEMIAYGEKVGVGRRWTESIPVDFHDPNWASLEIAKQFASLMDQNRYLEAGHLMAESCLYKYQGKIIEGVAAIIQTYVDNFESAKGQLDEIQFSSKVVPADAADNFKLKYLDRIRKGSSWFEHRCEQQIKIADGKVVQIEHFDLPGESEKLKAWFVEVGVKR